MGKREENSIANSCQALTVYRFFQTRLDYLSKGIKLSRHLWRYILCSHFLGVGTGIFSIFWTGLFIQRCVNSLVISLQTITGMQSVNQSHLWTHRSFFSQEMVHPPAEPPSLEENRNQRNYYLVLSSFKRRVH